MSATTAAPRVQAGPAGRTGLGSMMHAEWTKLRTVRGWVAAIASAPVVLVLLGLLVAMSSHNSYQEVANGPHVQGHPFVPLGPDGRAVTDSFTFAHRVLDGDGTLTARVSSLDSDEFTPDGRTRGNTLDPWAKAGLMIKASTSPGAAYAAVLVTGGHGVRMQSDFTGDLAGPATAKWLRLARSGDEITGYASSDGTAWVRIGTVRLSGLPAAAPAGLVATSPSAETAGQSFGAGTSRSNGSSAAVATFDHVTAHGGWAAGGWQADVIGRTGTDPTAGGVLGLRDTGGSLTVTGSGDVAPDAGGSGLGVDRVLIGTFLALGLLAVVAALFMSAEYRRGMISTTLTASPRRVRVLAAKAIVLASAAFVAGCAGAAVALAIAPRYLERNGNFVYPIDAATAVRLVAGTGGLVAVAGLAALALSTILRRGAGAVTVVVVAVVVPYLLATNALLPVGPSQWLLRLTPAAGFAVQQSVRAYPQVDGVYTPAFGFFTLAPWAGFAVLCGYVAVALAVAALVLRRRDA